MVEFYEVIIGILGPLAVALAVLYIRARGDVAELKRESKQDKTTINQRDQEIKRLEREKNEVESKFIKLKEQYEELMGKRFVRVQCPLCNNFIALPYPVAYQVVGVHAADGLATRSIRKGVEELGVPCPLCQKILHMELLLMRAAL